jgi:hypothetical protein
MQPVSSRHHNNERAGYLIPVFKKEGFFFRLIMPAVVNPPLQLSAPRVKNLWIATILLLPFAWPGNCFFKYAINMLTS